MGAKADLVKERYQQFAAGDLEGALSNWTDDFTWEGASSEDLPGGGTHQGRDKAQQALQGAVGAWDEFDLVPDEFYENGDTVVVLAHNDVKKGGQAAQLPVVHIWRVPRRRRSLQAAAPHRHAAERKDARKGLRSAPARRPLGRRAERLPGRGYDSHPWFWPTD